MIRGHVPEKPSPLLCNVFLVMPRSKVKLVVKILKALHAQESKKRAARENAKALVEELRSLKPKEVARKVENVIEKALTYRDSPSEHLIRIHTNNVIERLKR